MTKSTVSYMEEFTQALQDNTKSINALQTQFAVFSERSDQHQIKINELDCTVNGNGKPGLSSRLQRVEIYIAIALGVAGTGGSVWIGWIVIRAIEKLIAPS